MKNRVVNFLKEATAFDRAAREALNALHDKHPEVTDEMLAGCISALAWQLRDRLSPKHLKVADVIASVVCSNWNVEGYPGSERWVADESR
jgi:hypothetical protein